MIVIAAVPGDARGAAARSGWSGHFLDRLAVDAGLALQIVDRHVRVVPSEARPDPKALGQFRDARFRKPGLRRFTAVPEIDAAGAMFAVQVVLPDQPFFGEAAIGR